MKGGGFVPMLEPADRAVLLGLGHVCRFRRGATLTIQGDESDSVFVLLSGRVKVTITTPDGDDTVLGVLGPGELVGEFEALDPGPRTATNIAADPTECRVLTGEQFRAFLDAHPLSARVLLRILIERLRWADRRRVDSGSLDTPHRLARFLIEHVDRQHAAAGRPIQLDISLSQQELATLIGTSRESLVRALASMRAQRIVSTATRRITVCDLDGLRRYAAR